MPASASLRTPGLYFETQAPEPREVLPRLDIAAFVGFAASGPVGVPVAIEDPVTFEELFGADLTIGVPGRRIRTQLAPAVRAFFRNGGRRCWVVRVAGEPTSNEFVLPGIVGVRRRSSGISWGPAVARARSEGSWSDSLAVNTTLLAAPLPAGAVTIAPVESPPAAPSFSLALETGTSTIGAGDLLRIDVRDSVYTAFVVAPADATIDNDGRVEVPWSEALWLEHVDAGPWPFESGTIAGARHVLPAGHRESIIVFDARPLGSGFVIDVARDGGRPLREGSWIEIDVVAAGSPIPHTWLLHVDGTSPLVPTGSPSMDDGGLAVEGRRAWRFVDAPPALPAGGTIRATALTFELWTRDGRGRTVRLANLGFAKPHPRCWCDLPTDADLFPSAGLALPDRRALAHTVTQPRFPLAGPAPRDDGDPTAFLPLGSPAAIRGELEERAEPRTEPAIVRDGLDRIGADLFVDPSLRHTSAGDLMEHAFRVRYGSDGRANRLLRGLHALTHVDEISLIAAPDALLDRPRGTQSYDAPQAVTLAATATDARIALEWPEAEGAVAYTLEGSDTADFQTPSASERLVPNQSDELVTDDPPGTCRRRFDRLKGVCAPDRWYRVRIEGLSGGGPWSNTVRIRPAAATFDACGQVGADAPALSVSRSGGRVVLSWTDTGSTRYRLESSPEPTFAAVQLLFDGTGVTVSIVTPLAATYVRVRAQTQPPGAWSNSVRVLPGIEITSPAGTQVEIDEGMALEVNAALLRFSAARGDVFAVLGAPGECSETDVLEHKAQLVTPLLSRREPNIPSFGALYFPWLVVAQDGGVDAEPATVAPVGTICGLIAARTLEHGAWFAPANRPLVGVVSRGRAVDRASWLRLDAAQINAVWLQPQGYVTLSAHTLTPDRDLREISVRRFMILLRRLALREGPLLVFEPNGPDLRRAVRRQFERLLGDLYTRGALAGRTPAEAFQVIVDDTVNPPQSVDLGRLVVELRVAPSRPLAFLVVRFVLRGGAAATVEGV